MDEKNNNESEKQTFAVSLSPIAKQLSPDVSVVAPLCESVCLNILQRSGQRRSTSEGEQFLLMVNEHLQGPLALRHVIFHDGRKIQIYSQLFVIPADMPLAETAVHRAYQAELVEAEDELVNRLRHLKENRDDQDFEIEFRDPAYEAYLLEHKTLDLLAVGASLHVGEVLVYESHVQRNPDDPESELYITSRCLAITRSGRSDNLLDPIIGKLDGDRVLSYSTEEYEMMGVSGLGLIEMWVDMLFYHHGFKASPKHHGWLFALPWLSDGYEAMRLNIQTLQGPVVDPKLLLSGAFLGHSLREGLLLPVHLPDEFLSKNIYAVGETQTGKSTCIEHLISKIMQRQIPPRTVFVFEYKGRGGLIEHLIGSGFCNTPILYAPARFSFRCNLLDWDGHQVDDAETISCLARTAESRNPWGYTPTATLIAHTGLRALALWPHATLVHLAAFKSNKEFREAVLRLNPDAWVVKLVREWFSKIRPESELAFFNKLTLFYQKPLFSSTCQPRNDLQFRQAIEERRDVLIDMSGLTDEQVSDLGTFLLTKAARSAMQVGAEEKGGTTLVADEFHRWIHPGVFEQLLTLGNGLQTNVICAHQSPHGQLTKELRATVLGNCQTFIVFRLSDPDDARLMGKIMDVNPQELASLEAYQAYLKVGTLPAVKIQTLEPLPWNPMVSEQAVEYSKKQYGAPIIDHIDPLDLFASVQRQSAGKPREDELNF